MPLASISPEPIAGGAEHVEARGAVCAIDGDLDSVPVEARADAPAELEA